MGDTAPSRKTLMNAFNQMFDDFLGDILTIYPENTFIRKAKSYFDTIRQLSPAIIVQIWNSHVYSPYASIIDSGDIVHFVVAKDYSEDLTALGDNAGYILDVVEKLKPLISEMSEQNKATTMEYIRNLSLLGKGYAEAHPRR